jgi:hypothetical protein
MREKLKAEAYRALLENQKLNAREKGYACYRGISVDKICNQLIKHARSEFSGNLIKDLNVEMLKPLVEEICNKLCSETNGWVHIIKKCESIYYHPEYVLKVKLPRSQSFRPEYWYDPRHMMRHVMSELEKIDSLYVGGKAFKEAKWQDPFALYLDGFFYNGCCVSHKVKF